MADSPTELAADRSEAAQVQTTVLLVPLGEVDDDLVEAAEVALRDELNVEVIRREPIPLPSEAYYRPRKRYRADLILDHLDTLELPGELEGTVKVMGLTEVDISTTNGDIPDWGIFGLGSLAGRSCVVSTKRLKRRPKNRAHLRRRVASVVVHEVGHTLGLSHCDEVEARCVMLDAEGGIENTDTTTGGLGPVCRAKLRARGLFSG